MHSDYVHEPEPYEWLQEMYAVAWDAERRRSALSSSEKEDTVRDPMTSAPIDRSPWTKGTP